MYSEWLGVHACWREMSRERTNYQCLQWKWKNEKEHPFRLDVSRDCCAHAMVLVAWHIARSRCVESRDNVATSQSIKDDVTPLLIETAAARCSLAIYTIAWWRAWSSVSCHLDRDRSSRHPLSNYQHISRRKSIHLTAGRPAGRWSVGRPVVSSRHRRSTVKAKRLV